MEEVERAKKIYNLCLNMLATKDTDLETKAPSDAKSWLGLKTPSVTPPSSKNSKNAKENSVTARPKRGSLGSMQNSSNETPLKELVMGSCKVRQFAAVSILLHYLLIT